MTISHGLDWVPLLPAAKLLGFLDLAKPGRRRGRCRGRRAASA